MRTTISQVWNKGVIGIKEGWERIWGGGSQRVGGVSLAKRS